MRVLNVDPCCLLFSRCRKTRYLTPSAFHFLGSDWRTRAWGIARRCWSLRAARSLLDGEGQWVQWDNFLHNAYRRRAKALVGSLGTRWIPKIVNDDNACRHEYEQDKHDGDGGCRNDGTDSRRNGWGHGNGRGTGDNRRRAGWIGRAGAEGWDTSFRAPDGAERGALHVGEFERKRGDDGASLSPFPVAVFVFEDRDEPSHRTPQAVANGFLTHAHLVRDIRVCASVDFACFHQPSFVVGEFFEGIEQGQRADSLALHLLVEPPDLLGKFFRVVKQRALTVGFPPRAALEATRQSQEDMTRLVSRHGQVSELPQGEPDLLADVFGFALSAACRSSHPLLELGDVQSEGHWLLRSELGSGLGLHKKLGHREEQIVSGVWRFFRGGCGRT